MSSLSMAETEESIRKKLMEWIGIERIYNEESHVLSLDFISKKDNGYISAYALVLHEESCLEILYLFPKVFTKGAELSCDKKIPLLDQESKDNTATINQAIIDTTKNVYKTTLSLITQDNSNLNMNQAIVNTINRVYESSLSLVNLESTDLDINRTIIHTAKEVYTAMLLRK